MGDFKQLVVWKKAKDLKASGIFILLKAQELNY